MINEEKGQKKDTESMQESENNNNPEIQIESRINLIDNQINNYEGPQDEKELNAKMNEIEKSYRQAGELEYQESSQKLNFNMLDEIDFYKKELNKIVNLKRLKKASEIMTPDDFQVFESILGNHEGSTEELIDLRGKVLHTTNSSSFRKMLDSGIIKTESTAEGIYKTPGASFADGDFENIATFQTLFDDQNTRSSDKRFNSEKYSDKVGDFIKYFWDKDQGKITSYLSGISNVQEIKTLDDAIKIAEGLKFKVKDDPVALEKIFGITIVYDKEKLPELSKEGTVGIQGEFELRSYREGGVPISDSSVLFVPRVKIEEIVKELDKIGLGHIEVRASEELEVKRMIRVLDEKI